MLLLLDVCSKDGDL